MNEFENIVVGKSSIPYLAITVVCMIAIPVVFLVFWRRNHKGQTNFSYLIAGASGSTAAYVLDGTLMAGVFEECGRYVVLKYIMKKNRTRENSVMYGIGHGGIEILAVLLPSMITYLLIAVLFSSGKVDVALSTLKITEETAAAALPSVRAAASFNFALMAMNVVERVFAMLLHIGLTVIVFHGVVNSKAVFLPLAILLHMLMDTFPALYQRGVLPLWSVEVWAALCTAVVVLIAFKLYRRMEPQNN